jgi:flagellar biosynthetic protein FliQ
MLVVLLVGVLVGIFQAATSINEMTLSFVPKLIMVVLLLTAIGSWQIQLLVDFATHVFERIPQVAR